MTVLLIQTANGLTNSTDGTALYEIESRAAAFKNILPALLMMITDLALTILSAIPAIFSTVASDFFKRSAFSIIVDLSAFVHSCRGVVFPRTAAASANHAMNHIVTHYPAQTST